MCSAYRMPIARPKQFPSGFLVAALLAASGLLWAVMFFGPLAHLERPDIIGGDVENKEEG